MLKLKQNLLFEVLSSFFIVVAGVVISVITHSLNPLLTLTAILLITRLFQISAYSVYMAFSKSIITRYTPFHMSYLFVFTAFLSLFCFSVMERISWNQSNKPFDFLVSKDKTDKYTTNDHRLTKMICENKTSMPMEIKEADGLFYVRCGDFFPSTYIIKVKKADFNKAMDETSNDKPGQPIVIDKE